VKPIAALLALSLGLPAIPISAEERVDLEALTRIRAEGFRNSQVMALASELMDGVGPRVTGSTNMKLANDWARQRLAGWGLSNVRLEAWGPFGRGWEYEESAVRLVAPDRAELLALPEAWSPGTAGEVRAPAIRVEASSTQDLEKFRGKLSGRVVFFGEMPDVKPHDKSEVERYDEKSLTELGQYEVPGRPSRFDREAYRKRRELRRAADRLLAEEKAVAIVTASRRENSLAIQATHSGWKKNEAAPIPALVMSVEHFGRIARLLDRNVPVEVALDVRVKFLDADPMQANVVGEIPGTDKKGEVVMMGAHLDSWHAGTGATDNGAGSIVAMEAARILKSLPVSPRRTIRLALWSGEEQGLYGSKAYVAEHFATRPETTDPEQLKLPDYLRKPTWPITVKPDHARLSSYFNVDNGTGKIRGIYTEENAAVVPIFEAWTAPLRDLGVTTVTMNDTTGTDHESFDEVGLPAFQFIQDEVEYETRTHHTNLDTYERLQRDDLMQAAVVLASFVWDAATRPDPLPRKPMPKEPAPASKPAAR
jgi:carboxypeptidase Q